MKRLVNILLITIILASSVMLVRNISNNHSIEDKKKIEPAMKFTSDTSVTIEESKEEHISSKKSKIVYLDPGHGGQVKEGDPKDIKETKLGGNLLAIGDGIYEKDLNINIAFYVKEKLEEHGFIVYMRRTDDSYMHYTEIDEDANSKDPLPSSFVSIHSNWSSSPEMKGMVMYYPIEGTSYDPSGERITKSKELADSIGSYLHTRNIPYSGVKSPLEGDYHVLRNTTMYAVLVECGFMSNAEDAAYLIDPVNQKNMGESIALGILVWYRKNGWL